MRLRRNQSRSRRATATEQVIDGPTRSGSVEAGDVAPLPRRLDGACVVLVSDEGDRVARGHAFQHGNARERSAGSTSATDAADLNPFLLGSTPYLAQRVAGVLAICRQPQVRPADPSSVPWESNWRVAEQVQPEFGKCVVRRRPAESSSAYESTGRQAHQARCRRVPRLNHARQPTAEASWPSRGVILRRHDHDRSAEIRTAWTRWRVCPGSACEPPGMRARPQWKVPRSSRPPPSTRPTALLGLARWSVG